MSATDYRVPEPRGPQLIAKNNFLAETGNCIVQLPTGLGKSILSAIIAREYPGRRILFLAHTDTLVYQTCRTYMRCGMWPMVEKADEYRGDHYLPDNYEWKEMFPAGRPANDWFTFNRVWVSTIQTFIDRVEKYREDPFDLVVYDECHRSLGASFLAVANKLLSFNSSARILGLTATPSRGDKRSLAELFPGRQTPDGIEPKFAYRMTLNDGIREGYLVDIVSERGVLAGVDESMWKMSRNKHGETDISNNSVEKSMNNKRCIESIAHEVIERSEGRKGIVFLPGVAVTESVCAAMNAIRPGCAVFVHGKVSKRENKKRMRMVRNGEAQFILGCDKLCLDEKTEILTTDGWKGIDTLSKQDDVANWHTDGTITFTRPTEVIVRDRQAGEGMVSLQTNRHSVRVTDKHRMVWIDHKDEARVDRAEDLVGRALRIPVHGVSEPLPVRPEQAAVAGLDKARIRANSYTLRKQGMSAEDARAEAIRRMQQRDSLRHKNPDELTGDECEFIGFWMADGNKVELSSGGVEYRVMEGARMPNICNRIDQLIVSLGLDSKRRVIDTLESGLKVIQWSLSRGTGFGPQNRRGVYHLEPYLTKGKNNLLNGLSRDQFLRLLYGLWMGNGTSHHDRTTPPGPSFAFVLRHKELIDTIQAVAACRGIYCHVRTIKKVKENHSQQYIVHINLDRQTHSTHKDNHFQVEPDWVGERVWCVNVPSTFIVTRRNGSVTVMGNCEGYDDPTISLVVLARYTTIKGRYEQMLGRGIRVLPNCVDGLETAEERRAAIALSAKKNCKLIDFANSSRFKLVTVEDVLLDDTAGGGKKSKKLTEYVKKHRDPVDKRAMREQLEILDAMHAFEESLRQSGWVPPKYDFVYERVNLFGYGGTNQRQEMGRKTDAKRPTQEMVRQAEEMMIRNPESMTQGQLRSEIERRREKMVGRKNFGFLLNVCGLDKGKIDGAQLNWHDATYLRKLMMSSGRKSLPDNWEDLVAKNRAKRHHGGDE